MAALSLITNLIALPGGIAAAVRQTDTKKAELELEQKRAEVRAAGPRLDVSYLFLESQLLAQPVKKEKIASTEARTLLSFPVIRNEILDGLEEAAVGCKLGPTAVKSVVYLVIENRGKRDADRIRLTMSKLSLRRPVLIREAVSGGDDYLAKLRSNAPKPVAAMVAVPRPLAPGAGVRVPLWLSATSYDASNPWCVFSETVLQPASVTFHDPILDAESTLGVRRLQDPQVFADGVEGRG